MHLGRVTRDPNETKVNITTVFEAVYGIADTKCTCSDLRAADARPLILPSVPPVRLFCGLFYEVVSTCAIAYVFTLLESPSL